jgi:hypothetical protein
MRLKQRLDRRGGGAGPDRTTPVGIITLKNRTLSPVVERFIEYVRDFTRPMSERRPGPKR